MEEQKANKEKSLGMFILELRKEKGYTQGELADMLHISNKTISSWETDKTLPDIKMISVLANVFEITCDELLNCQKNGITDNKVDNQNIHNKKINTKLKIHRILIVALSIMLLVMFVSFLDVFLQVRTGLHPFETKIINNVAYKKNAEGTYSVVGLSNKFRGDTINIEEEINGIQVTKIDAHAFRGVSNFDTIVLSKNITSIEPHAFMHCSVSKVDLNEGLLKIGQYAFSHSYIKEIHLPDTLNNIDTLAFANCVNLKQITGGNGLEFVDNFAFENCVSLETVAIGGSVTFEEGVFSNTINLITAYLPNAKKLNSYVFKKSGLENLYLSNDFINIDSMVVYECYRLESVFFGGIKQNINDIII